MKKINKIKLAFAISLIGLSGQAFAESSTTSINLSTEVEASCVFEASDSIVLEYVPSTKTLEFYSMGITCTKGTSYFMELSAGGSNDQMSRKMKNANNHTLSYAVSQELTSLRWGSGDMYRIGGTGSGVKDTMRARVIVPALQYVEPGVYTDDLTITLTY